MECISKETEDVELARQANELTELARQQEAVILSQSPSLAEVAAADDTPAAVEESTAAPEPAAEPVAEEPAAAEPEPAAE